MAKDKETKEHLYVLWNIREHRVEGIHETHEAAEEALRGKMTHPSNPPAHDFEVLAVTK